MNMKYSDTYEYEYDHQLQHERDTVLLPAVRLLTMQFKQCHKTQDTNVRHQVDTNTTDAVKRDESERVRTNHVTGSLQGLI